MYKRQFNHQKRRREEGDREEEKGGREKIIRLSRWQWECRQETIIYCCWPAVLSPLTEYYTQLQLPSFWEAALFCRHDCVLLQHISPLSFLFTNSLSPLIFIFFFPHSNCLACRNYSMSENLCLFAIVVVVSFDQNLLLCVSQQSPDREAKSMRSIPSPQLNELRG